MNQTVFSPAEQDLAQAAGNQYANAHRLALDDARRGLKYMLLRLSLLGLSHEEQHQLRQLARLACAGAEAAVLEAAEQIKERPTASPLAVALADIVLAAPGQKEALLGALFGAYAGLGRGRNITGGITGAGAGALACATETLLQQPSELQHFLAAE
ncbi:MAG: hypothetical protein HY011_09125 [Acidobacteria bacterium]|nr:hypothetical protein [Acidobacteriota bacterium]